jgi:hypothetical protein
MLVAMTFASDLAELSSLRAQLDEVRDRVVGIATRYHETPDSAIASDLFEAERALMSAGRVIDRAVGTLAEKA